MTTFSYAQSADRKFTQQIKAAYLYNFLKFVVWPEQSTDSIPATKTICLHGPKNFELLFEPVKQTAIRDKSLIVKQCARFDPGQTCNIIFIDASNKNRIKNIIKSLQGSPVLTVSDHKDFAAQGGMIEFIQKENNIRFIINHTAAKAAGLQISSKLLDLAISVK
ncbi:MAG: YfiR family protein [Deltaproteobacteria bacterium]|nr:YfiR family protein [Deltaproteobacteria bacterium]